jgi:hypothetical protein
MVALDDGDRPTKLPVSGTVRSDTTPEDGSV